MRRLENKIKKQYNKTLTTAINLSNQHTVINSRLNNK